MGLVEGGCPGCPCPGGVGVTGTGPESLRGPSGGIIGTMMSHPSRLPKDVSVGSASTAVQNPTSS